MAMSKSEIARLHRIERAALKLLKTSERTAVPLARLAEAALSLRKVLTLQTAKESAPDAENETVES